MTAMNETIIKCDRQGRLRYSAEHKQALIEAYESSGLSGPKCAELHGGQLPDVGLLAQEAAARRGQ